MLYEDGEYEDYRNDMENRVSVLEGAICKILNLLETDEYKPKVKED